MPYNYHVLFQVEFEDEKVISQIVRFSKDCDQNGKIAMFALFD